MAKPARTVDAPTGGLGNPPSRDAILSAIPHRDPFLLLDEIVERSESRIVCRKRFTGRESFYEGHYPGQPITPGVLLCEAAMQAGAVLLSSLVGDQAVGRVPVATRMEGVKFKRVVRPGETIEIEVTLQERLADAFFLKAQVRCEGQLAARLEFACTLAAV